MQSHLWLGDDQLDGFAGLKMPRSMSFSYPISGPAAGPGLVRRMAGIVSAAYTGVNVRALTATSPATDTRR